LSTLTGHAAHDPISLIEPRIGRSRSRVSTPYRAGLFAPGGSTAK